MAVCYGTWVIHVSILFVPRGGDGYVAYGGCLIMRTVIYFRCFHELCRRFALFAQKCLMSDSVLVSAVSTYAILNGRMNSVFGSNARLCCSRYNVADDVFPLMSREFFNSYNFSKYGQDAFSTASLLLELICVRDGIFVLPMFSQDTSEVIRLLCST